MKGRKELFKMHCARGGAEIFTTKSKGSSQQQTGGGRGGEKQSSVHDKVVHI
jgi:hypothetical protein